MSALEIDVLVAAPQWAEALGDPEALARQAVAAVRAELGGAEGGALSLVLADDRAVQALNAQWRGADAPTNVLAFPAGEHAGSGLGDVILAYETCAAEAAASGLPIGDHAVHLIVHGFLHLLGYDHHDDAEAETMEAVERRALARLGIPDPYLERDHV